MWDFRSLWLGHSLILIGASSSLTLAARVSSRAPCLGCARLWRLSCVFQSAGGKGSSRPFFVFIVASPFGFAAFFVLNFFLQVTSCFKLSTGRVKGWEVTARGPAKPSASAAAANENVSVGCNAVVSGSCTLA